MLLLFFLKKTRRFFFNWKFQCGSHSRFKKIAGCCFDPYILQTTKTNPKPYHFLSWEFSWSGMDVQKKPLHCLDLLGVDLAGRLLHGFGCKAWGFWILKGKKHVDFLSFSSRGETNLGGGNSNIFWYFLPDFFGKMIQIDEYFFFRWVETTI